MLAFTDVNIHLIFVH